MSLQVHLPNNQLVSFSEDNVMTDILEKERDTILMLTAFFELNKTDVNARHTFCTAALERGLIKSDCYISDCLRVSSMHEMPDPLRRLFTTLIFCEPGDGHKLWNDHYESLSEDYILDCASVKRVQNMVLTDISSIIQSMGKSLSDFDLPNITADISPSMLPFYCSMPHIFKKLSTLILENSAKLQHEPQRTNTEIANKPN
ncbi:hypothetical protein CTI12_AA485010 [Artemisia annua]|uniref:Uncharacterized protein n=1 Tax=Artemisia annua TaxID=35608 RepID=A0A2U1LJ99_ARTAN|nr:hypothetical protein CTI12_AA485010 [Artemisia annua]